MFRLLYLSIGLTLVISSAASVAQNKPQELSKNPFSQPDYLNNPPPVVNRVVKENSPEVVPEFILTATFISVNGPMAIVNKSLLSIDEEIDGMRLITVGEDSARIRYKGKNYNILINQSETEKTQKIRLNKNVVK